jgi:hypothetical protein
MSKLIVIFTFLVLILSCEKSDNSCNFNDPLKDLKWLSDLKSSLVNCPCEISILQASYKGQTVFYVAMSDPLCDGIFPIDLRNCHGDVVKSYHNPGQPGPELTDVKNLYRCKTAK